MTGIFRPLENSNNYPGNPFPPIEKEPQQDGPCRSNDQFQFKPELTGSISRRNQRHEDTYENNQET
jgi:hypothetical protein